MVGMIEVGAPISLDRVVSSQIIGASAFVIFFLHHKTQKMACKNTIVGYNPMGTPTCLHKQEVGNPARMQRRSMLRHRVVFMRT